MPNGDVPPEIVYDFDVEGGLPDPLIANDIPRAQRLAKLLEVCFPIMEE